MTALDSRPWVCAGCGAVCTGAMSPGQLCLDCAASLPAARTAAAVRRCPAAGECESCGAAGDLQVLEADTPVGVLCLTLCGECADAGRTPRLSCPAAVGRAMAHERHAGAGVAW
jgi:DnaJ-class molecular chaperone